MSEREWGADPAPSRRRAEQRARRDMDERDRTLRSATSSSGPPTVERRAVAQAVSSSLISRSSD